MKTQDTKNEPTWCKHYQSMGDNDECKAGIRYDSMRGVKLKERPCFWKNRDRCQSCEHQEWPSQEELDATAKMWEDEMAKITKVMPIIKEIKEQNAGKSWRGLKDCPICDGGKLAITHAGCNGHCHCRCSTEGCISFME